MGVRLTTARRRLALLAVLPMLAAMFFVSEQSTTANAAAAQEETGPTLTLSKSDGLDPDGETITVDGSGFDPTANTGTRPPLAGQPSGVYVIFGDFATDWKPSEGAPTAAREVISQFWALPEPSFSQMNPNGDNPDYILLEDDGTFTADFDVAVPETVKNDNLGIYTYPGSGATNADQEVEALLTFDDGTNTGDAAFTLSKTDDLDPDGETITVEGTGFDPTANVGTRPPLMNQPSGFYVAFGDFDTNWKPSEGAPSSARRIVEQVWVLPQPSHDAIEATGTGTVALLQEDGSFTLDLPVSLPETVDGNLGVYVYAGGGAVNADHELARLVTFDDGSTGPSTTTTTEATTTTTQPVESAESVIVGGELEWGVYRNFVNYVNGNIAKGQVTTANGASGAPDGPFLFPVVKDQEVDVTDADLSIDFSGSVGFWGHKINGVPALEIDFSNFTVEKTGKTGKLLADASVRPFEDTTTVAEKEFTEGAHLADLDFSQARVGTIGDDVGWIEVPAVVAKGAEPYFGNFYEEGDTLDPVSIRLELTNAPDLDPAIRPTVDGPVVTLGASSVPAGGTIQVSGTGFEPDQQLEVWMHSTPEFLETIRADAGGAFDALITIPATATPGMHRLELRSVTSDLSAFSPEFEVLASAAGGGSSGALPRTGSDSGRLIGVGLMSIIVGGAALLGTRRARRGALVVD